MRQSATSTLTPASCQTNSNISQLLEMKERLPRELSHQLHHGTKDLMTTLLPHVAHFLHHLDQDLHGHDEETIRDLIRLFPDALSRKNALGHLPIYSAAWKYRSDPTASSSNANGQHGQQPAGSGALAGSSCEFNSKAVSFIPLLAKEGDRLNVGGEGKRGGLLVEDKFGDTLLKDLATFVHYGNTGAAEAALHTRMEGTQGALLGVEVKQSRQHNDGGEACDYLCVSVIQRLQKMGFFHKRDVCDYNLLHSSCKVECSKRFQYFVDLNPEMLMPSRPGSLSSSSSPFLLSSTIHGSPSTFEMTLKAGFKYFPHQLGFLFEPSFRGSLDGRNERQYGCRRWQGNSLSTGYKMRNRFWGSNETWKIVYKCLLEVQHEKGMMKLEHEHTNEEDDECAMDGTTTNNYQCGRLQKYNQSPLCFFEKNPETNLYPFMLAAEGETSELNMIYYLIRQHPVVLEGGCKVTQSEAEGETNAVAITNKRKCTLGKHNGKRRRLQR